MAKRLLIIEYDRDILDVMIYILQDDGFEMISSQTRVSPAYVLEISPAHILLDNRLADGFGHELCHKLKNDPATQQFPVILVSAVNRLASLAKGNGADTYRNKLFDLEELVSLVRMFTQAI